MARLSREDILAKKDIVEEEVEVEQWGGSVMVKSLSGKERARVVDECTNKKGKYITTKLYPALLVAGCVEPRFTAEDADALNSKNSGALETVAKVIMRLSGIQADDLDDEEEGEEEKN